MSSLRIILTGDGSHSILNEELHETYHSIHGAIQESNHVFIKNGLEFLIERSNPKIINILEIGFGTGLNALLTLEYALNHSVSIQYTTIEKSPVSETVWPELNYAKTSESKRYFEAIHQVSWSSWQQINPTFNLFKLETTLQQADFQPLSFDLVYYDAFAPNKQPEMWTSSALSKVVNALLPNGIFVTYCAKGQLKRDLKTLGLEVETLVGPPGKKEMVRGVKK